MRACEKGQRKKYWSMAHGATRPAALKNAEEALRFWIKTAKDDSEETPQPRGRRLVA